MQFQTCAISYLQTHPNIMQFQTCAISYLQTHPNIMQFQTCAIFKMTKNYVTFWQKAPSLPLREWKRNEMN